MSEKYAKVSIAFLCKLPPLSWKIYILDIFLHLPPFLENIYPGYISIFLLVVVETTLRAKLYNVLDLLKFWYNIGKGQRQKNQFETNAALERISHLESFKVSHVSPEDWFHQETACPTSPKPSPPPKNTPHPTTIPPCYPMSPLYPPHIPTPPSPPTHPSARASPLSQLS